MATVTGTTENTYANALEWECYSYNKNTLIVKNTHLTNALKLKVLVLTDPNGIQYPLDLLGAGITERILVADDNQIVKLNYHYHSIFVMMKSNIAETHASFQIDYIGGLQR